MLEKRETKPANATDTKKWRPILNGIVIITHKLSNWSLIVDNYNLNHTLTECWGS
jgi:hypothetical protein